MEWLKKLLVGKYVKGLLDKIPFNNYKTYIGFVLLVLKAALNFYGTDSFEGSILQVVINTLSTIDGVVPIGDAGMTLFITGIVHKILKAFSKK